MSASLAFDSSAAFDESPELEVVLPLTVVEQDTEPEEAALDESVGGLIGVSFVVLLFSTFYCCIPLFPPIGILPIFGGRGAFNVICRIVVSIPAVYVAVAVIGCFPLLFIPAYREKVALVIGWLGNYYTTPPGQ